MPGAELGHHPEEHDRDGLVVVQGRAYRKQWAVRKQCLKVHLKTFSAKGNQGTHAGGIPSSAWKVSLMALHSGLSAESSCCTVSTIRYMMLSSTRRSVLSAREMAGFLTALLQAALLL